jgi:glyoxylase-like metal-dependent hydrolase (beta-lactamase superfamily II)
MELLDAGIHRLGARFHNFYLVVDGGRATVIDAGGSRELPKLEKGLASLELSMADVEAILLTHAHTDHIGFAALAGTIGVEVKVHEREAAYAQDDSKGGQIGIGDLPLWRPRVLAFLIEMVRAGAARSYRLRSVSTVGDDEILDLPGRPRVIGTPGHTAGHTCYLLEDRSTLFTGDALVTDQIIRRATGPALLPEMFHADHAEARRSLDHLVPTGAELLLPGHGSPWRGPIGEAVALARSGAANP